MDVGDVARRLDGVDPSRQSPRMRLLVTDRIVLWRAPSTTVPDDIAALRAFSGESA